MPVAGIVSEFDPFHNGHAYLIKRVREELKPDAVVCVMSGAFTQRGMPALCGKFERARAAVLCGADLVIELPALYALGSADVFARGAIRMLKGLSCVTHLAFGSECADRERLLGTAKLLSDEPEELSLAVKEGLSRGNTYPRALSDALSGLFPGASDKMGPNDTLACCYIKELISSWPEAEIFPVKREGASHGSEETSGLSGGFDTAPHDCGIASKCCGGPASSDCGIASASYIRSLARSGNAGLAAGFMPTEAFELLVKGIESEALQRREETLFALLRCRILSRGPEGIKNAPEISEGLENRIYSAAERAKNLEELISLAKTKRFTRVRIQRALMQILLGITSEKLCNADKNGLAYAKVLAFNANGAKILKTAQEKGNIPVLSNINKNAKKDAPYTDMLLLDILSNDIYSIISGKSVADYSDKVLVPIITQL